MDVKELRKKATKNPQSLTRHEWDVIYKDAFSVPKKVSDERPVIKKKVKKTMESESWWG